MKKRQNGHRVGQYSLSNIAFNLFNYGFLGLLCLVCLYPIIYVLFASVSDPGLLMQHKGLLLAPLEFTLKGYQLIFKDSAILSSYLNTLVYVTAGTVFSMMLTIMGAFALSRSNLMLKKPIMFYIVFTMFFGGGLIPWYLLMRQLGLYDNLAAMVIPGGIATWDMIIMRTAFQSVPQDLEDAAIIDGASQFRILVDVVLPLSKATLAVILLYYIVGKWNDWFRALVLMPSREKWPLQLVLREYLIRENSETVRANVENSLVDSYRELAKYCMVVISSAPILCIYPFIQKYFVKGVMLGSVKG